MALLACGAQAQDKQAREAIFKVGEALRANDCDGAIKDMNAGLKEGYPEVELMAGTLFELGICLKKDWGKAVQFYAKASEGGLHEGALRLAAGYAADEHGPDRAAAMWWAKRARLDAGRCTTRLPATDDPDRFVEELGKWEPRELAICNHVIGHLASIYGDTRYPRGMVTREISAAIEGSYKPASSNFRVKQGYATYPAMEAMSSQLVRTLGFTGRYKKPDGIHPDWEIPFKLVFDLKRDRWW